MFNSSFRAKINCVKNAGVYIFHIKPVQTFPLGERRRGREKNEERKDKELTIGIQREEVNWFIIINQSMFEHEINMIA